MSDTLAEFCRRLRQGDLAGLGSIVVGGEEVDTPNGVVIISQTCDLVLLHDRPNVLLAKAVSLDPPVARDALRGKRPRWVPVTDDESGLFADLEYVATMPKDALVGVGVTRSFPDEEWSRQRKFAMRVGRRFSRLALPDDVVPWFENLSELVLSKAGKASSPLGRAIAQISELRVQADSWSSPGASVTMFVVLEPGELPVLPDDPDDWGDPPEYIKGLNVLADVAARLFPESGSRPHGIERDALWRRFADLVRDRIVPSGPRAAEQAVVKAVIAVTVSVVDENEFTMGQYRRSDELDLSHLSSPLPLDAPDGS